MSGGPTDWEGIVTTALLGTDRRPLPATAVPAGGVQDHDLAEVLLDLAAERRAASRAGTPPATCSPPPVAPEQGSPLAPPAAQDLLADLLSTPEPALVNLWLAACADRGLGVAVAHWPRLAELASRSTGYHRGLLRRVLGARGSWFLRHNPRWSTLTAEQPAAETGVPDPAGHDAISSSTRPALSPEQARMGLELIASGSLGPQTRPTAERLASQLPLTLSDLVLEDWASSSATAGVSPALRRTVELSLELIRRTVHTRLAIRDAFADHPSGDRP